jgi:hypothetical protein
MGLSAIITFYVFWSAYVVYKLKDPAFLAPIASDGEVTDEQIKEETEKIEKLPINERPFYQVGMVKKQK